MKIEVENNKLVVSFESWDFASPIGKKLYSMLKKIPHKQLSNRFVTNTSYERYLSEIFYFPFSRTEVEEGERAYKEFMQQFEYQSPF